jgi:plastocyanin
MRPGLRIVRAVVTLSACGWLLAPPAHAATKNVSANGSNTFAPGTVTVNVGDTVAWTNTGGVGHTVTSSTSNWKKDDSIPVLTATTSYVFDAPGTYRYFCSTHGTATSGMRGAVIVVGTKPKPSPTPSKSPSPRPSPSRTATPPPSTRPTNTPSPSTPAPSGTGAATPIVPTGTVPPPSGTPTVPPPTVLPGQPTEPPSLGEGGLTGEPASGRNEGLPLMIALLLVGGVGSAEVRALLANAP